MKFTVARKGGSGKTTIAGTVSRVMESRGHRVLATDDDSRPNPALTIGIAESMASGLPGLADDLLHERQDTGGTTRLEHAIPAEDFIVAPGDRLTLLLMGQPDHGGSG